MMVGAVGPASEPHKAIRPVNLQDALRQAEFHRVTHLVVAHTEA